jgi:hypothetical protein
MANSSVEIELVALVSEATKTVKEFAKDTKKQLGDISFAQNATAIATSFLAIKSAAETAFSFISATLGESINEANQAEQSYFKLANTLKLIGGYTPEAVQGFEELAKSLQKTTSFSDDAILSAAGLAKSFDLSNKEVQRLLPIAADLAVFLGTDIDEAARTLARTLNGDLERSLAKNIKSLRSLSQEQLINGEALTIIEKKVKGTASAFSETFQGSVTQLKNSFSDVFEELGKIIVQNPQVVAAIKSLAEQFGVFAKFVSEVAPLISSVLSPAISLSIGLFFSLTAAVNAVTQALVVLWQPLKFVIDIIWNGIKAAALITKSIYTLGKGFDETQKSVENFVKSLNPLNIFFNGAKDVSNVQGYFNTIYSGAIDVQRAVNNAARSIENLNNKTKQGQEAGKTEDVSAATRQQILQRQKILEEFNSKRAEIERSGLTELEKVTQEFNKNSKLIIDARNQGIITSDKERDKLLLKLANENIKKIKDINEKELKDRLESQRKLIESASKNPIQVIIDAAFGKLKLGTEGLAAAGTGLVNQILKGAEGAKGAVTGILGGIADAIVPGIGGVVSEIAGALAQGPEKTKEMIQGFVKAVPEFIKGLVASIPTLITELVKAIPQLGMALAAQAPFIAIELVTNIIKNIPAMVKGFAEQFLKIPALFVDQLLSLIGLGGDGGFLGLFANGGRVPDVPKYQGDKFPARLSAGEQVLSKDLSTKLESFLSGGGTSGQPMVVNVVVGQQQLARAIFDLNRGGFRTA